MKKNYFLLFSLLLATCFYGQNIDEASISQLDQDKVQEIEGFKMYPNPVTNGVLRINTFVNAEKKVQIFDVLGTEVLSRTIKSQHLNVSNLKSGIYILKVFEQGKTATRKLVIK